MPDIIYEDKQLLVCRKPAGLAVQNASFGRMDLESMVRTYLMEKYEKANPYVGVVHRLDQPVQGLVVFAKTPSAAAQLSAQVQDGRMKKEYLAVVCGRPPQTEGTLIHYLKKEPTGNCSRAVPQKTPGAKRAELDYRVLAETEGRALVKINLHTGRHHQIRVQMAESGAPLYGDAKYNPLAQRGEQIALCASRLAFTHPTTGKEIEFFCQPVGFPAVVQARCPE